MNDPADRDSDGRTREDVEAELASTAKEDVQDLWESVLWLERHGCKLPAGIQEWADLKRKSGEWPPAAAPETN